MRGRSGALMLAAMLQLGCYEYVPGSQAGMLTGRRVQIVLTDFGAVSLAPQLGPSVESLEGTLVADSLGSYRVAMATTRLRSGLENGWRGEVVVVSRTLAASVAERRFSPSRTLFAGSLAAAGIVSATLGLRGKGESSGGSQTPGTGTGK